MALYHLPDHLPGPHGYPAITADPQRRSWVESSKGGRWTCSACSKAIAIRDDAALADFALEHAHQEAA